MPRGRILTATQRKRILEIALMVRRRRKALGITQTQLDQECGFTQRTVDRVERTDVGHRSFLPDDSRVKRVLDTLSRLQRKPDFLRPQNHSRPVKRRVEVAERERPTEEIQLSATVRFCPDHSVWITQGGCDGLIASKHLTCRSMRGGKGCRGVKHRPGLPSKEIEVTYTPPKPDELDPNPIPAWRAVGS